MIVVLAISSRPIRIGVPRPISGTLPEKYIFRDYARAIGHRVELSVQSLHRPTAARARAIVAKMQRTRGGSRTRADAHLSNLFRRFSRASRISGADFERLAERQRAVKGNASRKNREIV